MQYVSGFQGQTYFPGSAPAVGRDARHPNVDESPVEEGLCMLDDLSVTITAGLLHSLYAMVTDILAVYRNIRKRATAGRCECIGLHCIIGKIGQTSVPMERQAPRW